MVKFYKHIAIMVVVALLASLAACTPKQAPTPSAPSGTGRSVTIDLTADNIDFDKGYIKVNINTDVTIVFNNRDSIPHNLAIYETAAAAKAFFVGGTITGPATISYHFTTPSTPGTYFFHCDVHPTRMTGAFIICCCIAFENTGLVAAE